VRIGDKRILLLVKAFLKAGILTQAQHLMDTSAGTPQGGILSPLLANVALTVLDEHFEARQGGPRNTTSQRQSRRRRGLPNCRLVRYADDFVVMVSGSRAHAEVLREEVTTVLSTVGLRLSEQKTLITHIDEGLDFLGWRIQRHRKRGAVKQYVYTYPAKKAVKAITGKIKQICKTTNKNMPLAILLHRLRPVLRGWCSYFRPGVSFATFQYLRAYTWGRVYDWMNRKHPKIGQKDLRRRYGGGWWPRDGDVVLFDPGTVSTTRYRYRGTVIPSPWRNIDQAQQRPTRIVESPVR